MVLTSILFSGHLLTTRHCWQRSTHHSFFSQDHCRWPKEANHRQGAGQIYLGPARVGAKLLVFGSEDDLPMPTALSTCCGMLMEIDRAAMQKVDDHEQGWP